LAREKIGRFSSRASFKTRFSKEGNGDPKKTTSVATAVKKGLFSKAAALRTVASFARLRRTKSVAAVQQRIKPKQAFVSPLPDLADELLQNDLGAWLWPVNLSGEAKPGVELWIDHPKRGVRVKSVAVDGEFCRCGVSIGDVVIKIQNAVVLGWTCAEVEACLQASSGQLAVVLAPGHELDRAMAQAAIRAPTIARQRASRSSTATVTEEVVACASSPLTTRKVTSFADTARSPDDVAMFNRLIGNADEAIKASTSRSSFPVPGSNGTGVGNGNGNWEGSNGSGAQAVVRQVAYSYEPASTSYSSMLQDGAGKGDQLDDSFGGTGSDVADTGSYDAHDPYA
jgi:hypothetical protein